MNYDVFFWWCGMLAACGMSVFLVCLIWYIALIAIRDAAKETWWVVTWRYYRLRKGGSKAARDALTAAIRVEQESKARRRRVKTRTEREE